MECFLVHHARHLFFPNRATSWHAALTHDYISILEAISFEFMHLKAHLSQFVESEFAPSDIQVGVMVMSAVRRL